METIFQFAMIFVALYVAVEVATAVYIFRNRRTLLPQIFSNLRQHLGLGADAMRRANSDYELTQKLETLDRKINYVARHTKFEREYLRKVGILAQPASNATQLNPSNRN